jgi:phosphoglycerate kinase
MMMLSMHDVDLIGKRVLIREDFNVPMINGEITDDQRIRAALPTLRYALDAGAGVMIMTHLGRPLEGQFNAEYSTQPIAERLAQLLGRPVRFVADWQDGVTAEPGEVTLLENVRFNVGENSNDDVLALRYASLCDVFIMDAFGTAHRAQASTHGVARYAPVACAGLLLNAEISALTLALSNPKKPVMAIVGGSKVSSKLTVLHTLSTMVNTLIVGGGIANTFIVAAGYKVGKSLYEPDLVNEAKSIMAQCEANGVKLPIPEDVVVADRFSDSAIATVKAISEVGSEELILDVGPQTLRKYAHLVESAKTIIWNGPLGVFEMPQFAQGTQALTEMIANSHAFSLAGGGDTIAAIEKFKVKDKISYISTGGGAFLEFLEGKPLPGIAILEQRYESLPHI